MAAFPVADVPDDSSALRRISEDWYVPDGRGGRRVSSAAFQLKDGTISVGLECVILALGLTSVVMISKHPSYGLAAVHIGVVRGDLGLGVRHDPTPEEPWHGGIHGKITKSCRNQLAVAATGGLVVRPPAASQPG